MNRPELMVVMPVYNEQASIKKVAGEWFDEIQNWTEDFVLLVINDGSTDNTQSLLKTMASKLGPRFEVYEQQNIGHGQSCLKGYKEACIREIPFVFQIDSDGQCDPQYFFRFWRQRERFDVIYGNRIRRDDGWRRVVASKLLRSIILITCRVWCIDSNVPYRLMKTKDLLETIQRIPNDFCLANVALAVLLRHSNEWSQGVVNIHFRERYGGEPSVRMSKFGEKAIELVTQLRTIL